MKTDEQINWPRTVQNILEQVCEMPVLESAEVSAEVGKYIERCMDRVVSERTAALQQENERLKKERNEAMQSRASTQRWYAERWERMKRWARTEAPPSFCDQFFNILANGTRDVFEPPTYAQQMSRMEHERASLRNLLREVLDQKPSGSGWMYDAALGANLKARIEAALEATK